MRVCRVIAVMLAAVVLTSAAALAQQVGTATAVNPTSESTPPGATTVALTVGAHVVHKERIHTTPTGSVQLLFLDKSTLSIAPNSSIVIDEFVYDPNSGQGHMLATLTEGTLRYVGGKLSHAGEATINTPAATIGIRGATGTIHYDKHGTQVFDHFGIFTVHNGGGTVLIRRPDFYVTALNWNTMPSDPMPTPQSLNNHYLSILTSKPGQNGGVPGLKTVVINDCGLAGTKSNNCPSTPWMNTDAGESDAFQLIIQATQQATSTTGPQTTRRTRSH